MKNMSFAEAARAHFVTPRQLLDFARQYQSFICYRLIQNQYEEAAFNPAHSPFHLRNSALIPRRIAEMVPAAYHRAPYDGKVLP